MKLRPLVDSHEVDYWYRQIQIGAWLAVGVTLFGCLRVAVAWDSDQKWWLVPLIVAAVSQGAAAQLPWKRLVRRAGVRELLILWWVLEIPVLFGFSLADDYGRVVYLPGVMLVVTTAAALYPPGWVVTLGAVALAGFLGLVVTRQAEAGVTFAVGMSVILGAVVGLNALIAAARMRQDSRRRSAERRTELLLENASDAVLALGAGGDIRYVSPSVSSLLGHDPGHLARADLANMLHPEDLPQAREWLVALSAAPAGQTARCEVRLRRADGEWIYADVVGANQVADPDLGAIVISFRDITARRKLEEELTRQAFADSLTGLANRALFRDRIGHAVARHQRDGGRISLLLIDLDDFKTVNDTLGHEAGDTMLVTVAGRIAAQVRPADTLARLGGDEFAVLVEDLDDLAVAALAERIVTAVRQPISLGARDVICTMSIGIAEAKAGDLIRPEELLRDADLAMYASKRGGRDRYTVFDPAMHEDVLRETRRRAEMEQALERDEFFLQYQPIVDLPGGDLIGVEALVRWRHPTEGVLSPDAFIAMAEETGLIVPLGRWIARQACAQLATWQRDVPGSRRLHMSVNVSARQFQNAGFVDDLALAIADAGIEASALVMEITESLFIDDTEAVLATLQEVHDLGVRVAIDDFGTGYSALSYLQKFPIDILKIDRSLVDGTGTGVGHDNELAEAVIRMGRALRLQTVAEGIETSTQSAALSALGCDLGQGFYYARPVDSGDIAGLLAAGHAPLSQVSARHC